MDLKNIAELYELWCFFQVVQSATDVLRPPTTAAIPERTISGDLDERLNRELDVTWEGGVRVSYNPTFSQARPNQPSYSVPLRPDVSLFIADGPASGYHLFDAKFRLDRIPARAEESALDEEEAEERQGTFKRADLYKMHTYREAISGARSVRIMYPGTERRFFCADRAQANSGVELDGVGAVPVVPDASSSELAAVVRGLLSATTVAASSNVWSDG